MSIFEIIGLTFLIATILGLIAFLFCWCIEESIYKDTNWYLTTPVIIGVVIWISAIFIGIGINTEEEKVFVKKYLAQKHTIEASLEAEELSGLERIELVKQATELNGELAERKATFELWHFVVYDNTIYDNVELIKFR